MRRLWHNKRMQSNRGIKRKPEKVRLTFTKLQTLNRRIISCLIPFDDVVVVVVAVFLFFTKYFF